MFFSFPVPLSWGTPSCAYRLSSNRQLVRDTMLSFAGKQCTGCGPKKNVGQRPTNQVAGRGTGRDRRYSDRRPPSMPPGVEKFTSPHRAEQETSGSFVFVSCWLRRDFHGGARLEGVPEQAPGPAPRPLTERSEVQKATTCGVAMPQGIALLPPYIQAYALSGSAASVSAHAEVGPTYMFFLVLSQNLRYLHAMTGTALVGVFEYFLHMYR